LHLLLWFRDTKLVVEVRRVIQTWPWYQHYPNDSKILFYAKMNVRTLLSFFSDTVRFHSLISSRLQRTLALEKSESGDVLLIGNGPSAHNLTVEEISYFKSTGGKIAVMNNFWASELSETFSPDYYFIADSDYWAEDESNYRANTALKNYFQGRGQLSELIQPATKEPFAGCKHSYIYFDSRSLAGIRKYTSPVKPWCVTESVSLKSIAMLNFLGFKAIYFTGLDSVISRSFFVDDMNVIHWNIDKHYFYDNKKVSKDEHIPQPVSPFFRNFADILIADGIFRLDFYKVAKNCINVGQDQTNDSAPRACLLSFGKIPTTKS
jgi:hypothetical protein